MSISFRFYFQTISERLKYHINNKEEELIRFIIPYVNKISEKFKKIINGTVSKIAFYSVNKLRSLIRVHKDPLLISAQSNVVYRIACKDCEASYVGQTSRQIKTRI